jgi:hypothetical protein
MTAEDSTVSLELGGQQLRDAAHAAAGAHVDQHYPWDGTATSPSNGCRPTSRSYGSGWSAR